MYEQDGVNPHILRMLYGTFAILIKRNVTSDPMPSKHLFYKSIAGRYLPVRVVDGTIKSRKRFDGPITASYRFIKNASWVETLTRHSSTCT